MPNSEESNYEKEPLKNRFSSRTLQISCENFEARRDVSGLIRRGAVKNLQPKFAKCSRKDVFQRFQNLVKRHPAGTLFQSLAFGKFQETIPYRGKSWALVAKNGGASCLIIRIKLPLGFSWLWAPYGPLMESRSENQEARIFIFEDLERIAKEERAIFARIEPPMSWDKGWTDALKKDFNICAAPYRFTPQHTLVLNLSGSEEEILAQMKPKGRYNIGVAKRKGVRVRMFKNFADAPREDFDEFYELLKKTSARDKFGIHPRIFYENFLRTLGQENMSALFLAYEPTAKKVIAGLIATLYKDTATYYYGASSDTCRNFMAPYLLQWEAVLEARKRGLKFYDFLGIAPSDDPNHPWKGVTEFKKKFGGRAVSYLPAFDIVYKPAFYNLMKIAKRFL